MRRLGLLLCALVLAACTRADETIPTVFTGRMDDWAREILAESPETATRAGLGEDVAGRGFGRRLDDRSAFAEERRRGAAERRLVELRGVAREALTPAEMASHAALSAQFEAAAGAAAFAFGRFDPLSGASPYVLNQLDGAYLTLPDFFDVRVGVASFEDADTYLARLSGVAEALDAETARQNADAAAGVIAPDFVIDRTIANIEAQLRTPAAAQPYVTSLETKLAALLGETPTPLDASRARRLTGEAERIVATEITPALQRQAQALRSLRVRAVHDAGVWRLPQGDAYYRAQLRFATTTALTPDEVHAIGRERVAVLTQELDLALRRIGRTQGTVSERMRVMTADPQYAYPQTEAGREQLLADVRARVAAVSARAARWFAALPKAKLEVRRVPTTAEASSPGAYYDPPALDGSTPGVYYINLRSMGEMTRIDLPTQDYHEAVPGHHFQSALARERTDLPLLRRLINVNAYAEGWGLYAEQLADEQDLYDNDPVGRIGYLRWQLWRAARLVVDTGMHAKRWSRKEAIAYLAEVTGDTPGVIVSEVERYAAWPGQACGYELGRREIVLLRDEARAALGPDFDIRGFHDAVLAYGDTPLSALALSVRAWIAVRRAETAAGG